MQCAVIFDIDGTLSDNSCRLNILDNNPQAWDEFFSLMGEDLPNQAVCDLYCVIEESNRYSMIIVTGRPERYRRVTELWLTMNKISFASLFMRKDGDFRSDIMVKQEILQKLRKEYHIAFAVDDRTKVVEMLRHEGIVCLQCANNA